LFTSTSRRPKAFSAYARRRCASALWATSPCTSMARHIGQSVAKRGIACLVEGGEPAVEEAAGGGVGNKTHLVAEARQADEDGGVNRADVVSRAGRHRSVGGITTQSHYRENIGVAAHIVKLPSKGQQ
jgi:hypothetical protein